MSDELECRDEAAPKKKRGPCKPWLFLDKYPNANEAKEFVSDESTWSRTFKKRTEDGEKWFYRCNKVKRRGPQCAAELYLLFVSDSEEVFVYRKDAEHNHDEIETQRNRGIEEWTRIEINNLLDLRLKPRAILAHLEKMEGIVLPTKTQLNNYVAERKRRAFDTSVIYSGKKTELAPYIAERRRRNLGTSITYLECTPEVNRKEEVPLYHSDECKYEVALTDDQGTNQLCNTLKCKIGDEVAVSSFCNSSDESKYEIIPNKQALNKHVRETECRDSNSADEVPMYSSNESENVDVVAPKRKRRQNKPSGSQFKFLNVKEAKDRTECIVKEELSLYRSDGSESEGEIALKKMRRPPKVWLFEKRFSNVKEAVEFMNAENTWSQIYKRTTGGVEKWFYRCNKVKKRGPQCAAELHLLLVSNSDAVLVYRKDAEHNHDEIGTQGSRGIEEATKVEINNLLDLRLKPRSILAHLKNMDGIVLPTKRQLGNYIAEKRRRACGTSVIYSEFTPEDNRKEIAVYHSDESKYEVALTGDQGPNQLCDTLKCKIEDESEHEVAPNKQVLNKNVREAECRHSSECNSADEVPMYCSNESDSENDLASKKKREENKHLAPLNKCSNVKKAEDRTECIVKEELSLYRSDGSESEGEIALKKMRRSPKVWLFENRFYNVKEAEEFMDSENTWSQIYKRTTGDGEKLFYRCNKVKKRGPQCAAELHLLFVGDGDEVLVYRKDAEHNHDEIETQGNRGIEESTKIEINNLLDLRFKPRAILAELEKIDGIVVPTKLQLNNYIAVRRRCTLETSIISSGPTPENNRKEEFPVYHSVESEDEIALKKNERLNPLCDTMKCKNQNEAAVSSLSYCSDESEYEVAPSKKVLHKSMQEAECRQSSDEVPVYCSNESDSEDEWAPKKKREQNKILASLNKCSNVKEAEDRTECIVKVELSLYRSDGSESEGEIALKKKRRLPKVWLFENRLSNVKDAEEFMNAENTWSHNYKKTTGAGEKLFYRCNKVKKRGPQCAAELYLLFVGDGDEVLVYRKDAEHNHDEIENQGNRGIEESTKIEINNLLDLRFKPRAILAELEKIDGIVVPTKLQLNNYIAVRRRCTLETSVISSGSAPENNRKEEVPVYHSVQSEDEIALKKNGRPNPICDTLKCENQNEAAVSSLSYYSDESEYEVAPNKEVLNKRVEEAECRQSSDEVPMYFSNKSVSGDELAPKKKGEQNKILASLNKCSNVKEAEGRTECIVKEELSLYRSDGSESEGEMALKKMRRPPKVWLFENRFSNVKEAEEFMNAENTWSQNYKKTTGDGDKWFYRCNKVKKRGPQCAAEMHLLLVSESDEVLVYRKDAEHNHDEIGPQGNRGIEESTKLEINKLLDLRLKPRAILAHLEKMEGIVLPTKTKLAHYIAERRRRTFGTSVVYSEPEEQVKCSACSDLIRPDAAMYRCVECAAATLCGRCLSVGHDRHCLMRLPSTRVYRVLEDLFQQLRLEVCGRLGKDGDDLVEELRNTSTFQPDTGIKAEETPVVEDFEPQLEPDPLATAICRQPETALIQHDTEYKVNLKPLDNTVPDTLKPKLKIPNISFKDGMRQSVEEGERQSRRQNSKEGGRQRIEDSKRQKILEGRRQSIKESGRKSIKNSGQQRNEDKRQSFEDGGRRSFEDGGKKRFQDGRRRKMDDSFRHRLKYSGRKNIEDDKPYRLQDGKRQRVQDGTQRRQGTKAGRLQKIKNIRRKRFEHDNLQSFEDGEQAIVQDGR